MTLAAYGHTAHGNSNSLVALVWVTQGGSDDNSWPSTSPLRGGNAWGLEPGAGHSHVYRGSKTPCEPVVPQMAKAPELLK